jgi:two-component system sensor histidine kinase/response regulator
MHAKPLARLLIVDDEAPQVTALCRTLKAEGYAATGFTLASQALAALRHDAFDILITDLAMPEMDGISLLRAANELDRELVGIVMTGHGTIGSAVEAMKSGALDYILKPFNLNGIRPVLARALAIRQLRRENRALQLRVQEHTAELEAANRELSAANRELEAFAYSVSHDLRAPLRAIDAFSQLLTEQFHDALPAEARRLLDRISAKTHDMGRLIADLLQFARFSRQPLAKQVVNVTSLVQQVFRELRAEQPDRKVAILAQNLPDAFADPALLKQVFVNLEANALKFTRHREQPTIEINGRCQAGECTYCVRDNGVGFDMRDAGKLFGIFQRLHSADDFEGTGVGLCIVHRIVERHGGARRRRGGFQFYAADEVRSRDRLARMIADARQPVGSCTAARDRVPARQSSYTALRRSQ